MHFKTDQIETEFHNVLKPKARILAYAIDGYLQHIHGVHLVITSIWRENSKQHRGGFCFDFRVNMTKRQGDAMLREFNSNVEYGGDHETIADEREDTGIPNWTAPCFHAQINWRNLNPWV